MTKRLAARLKRLGRAAPAVGRELAGIAGLCSMAYGAALIYRPAGWIVAGVILVAAALIPRRKA